MDEQNMGVEGEEVKKEGEEGAAPAAPEAA